MHGDIDIIDPAIEEYLTALAGSPHPVEAEMRLYADERGGFPIVGPAEGAFLEQLALLAGARRVFEVGSGFGYSAFWFARAVGQGGSVTLTDHSRDNLDRAREWLLRAGLLERCRLEAGDGLAALEREEPGIDLVFLDLDKQDYPRAFALALPRLRPGGLLVADNVLWGGAVARGERDAATEGIREYLRLAFGGEGLVSSLIPLRDGVAITLKR